ncbi:hypothetical protein EXW72_28385 [Pseudomonas sp. BCA14]|uniref:hypothetical protein n=1 Tax=unclassified Pseudomonas TaxID=196821 RepID=UPI00106F03BF|nr:MULTISPECIES: hypothetical protein [unclassified Pseudomonas]TFF06172.1 hypothetical protein EXW70_20175 [Pseudomonas sp. JMN1]TFF08425.1 hypothetical protein EXW71_20775 [Pseudomonas sp. BCA17]TFF17828.1 hypothetical protein EXW72_28385 [Pseudomonas sp. BCA14]TFF27911.1 hypothetical protein EXW73_10815 [Pseudomonas sp. BCA13]
MNSAALLVLNSMALAALVFFHVQSTNAQDTAQINQSTPHHLQQRPQLAVMTATPPALTHTAEGTQDTAASQHWVF